MRPNAKGGPPSGGPTAISQRSPYSELSPNGRHPYPPPPALFRKGGRTPIPYGALLPKGWYRYQSGPGTIPLHHPFAKRVVPVVYPHGMALITTTDVERVTGTGTGRRP